MVLLPAVKLDNPPGANLQVLKKSAILLTGIGGAALLFFWLFPGFVMGVLMGQEYRELAWLLPRLSLVIFIVSILNLVIMYFMALRRYSLGIVVILGVAVTCGLVGMNHGSPQAVVDSMLYGTLLMSGLLAGWAGVQILRQTKQRVA
jgi:O-antigen/teichoic acid export membrane protein